MKFTVVTVTYDEEYPLLLIQARSIVEYVPSADLEEVIFIKNCGREATKNSKYFEKAVKTLLDAGLKVRVLHRDDYEVSPELSAANGWKDQQAMKILVANDIATDHYLLLDTKNFFTRRTGVEQLFRNGKAITF